MKNNRLGHKYLAYCSIQQFIYWPMHGIILFYGILNSNISIKKEEEDVETESPMNIIL